MAAPYRTHYLNADFDLSLRPRPRQWTHANLERQTRELTAQGLLGAGEGDAALVRVEIPDAFLDYLGRCGIPTPRVLRHPNSDPDTVLTPFGWNAEAGELNRGHHGPAEHPSLDCVRTVNSRSFALALERKLFPDSPVGRLVANTRELEAFLSGVEPDSKWILKSEFGNAGLSNRRVSSTGLNDADRRFVDARLTEDDRLLIEPFHDRLGDWSMVFDVPFDAATLRFHDVVCTRDGALIGALFDPATLRGCARGTALASAARRIAAGVARAGYFGPVCVDGFSHGDASRPRIRPLVDLNGRRSLTDGAFRLWQRIAPQRTLYYRFFAWAKLALPEDLSAAVSAVGDAAFDRSSRRGVLLGSPPRFAGPDLDTRPFKLAVLFFADDRASALALEHQFRDRFEISR